MQKQTKALLFDMDGTLVDSYLIVFKAWQQFAQRYGLDLNQILAVSHGRPSIDTIKLFASNNMDLEKEALIIDELNLIGNGEKPIAGALEFLTKLPKNTWGIVTSASQDLAIKRLNEAGLPIPEVLIAEDHVNLGKPHPEGYLKAAELLKVDPSECIIFEDAPAGVMAGNSANIPVVIVGRNPSALILPHIANITDYLKMTVEIKDDYINLFLD